MVKRIPLQNGKYAIVDDEDYEKCKSHVWQLHVTENAKTVRTSGGIALRRYVTGVCKEERVIHKDDDILNCTKENLEIISPKDQTRRRKGDKNATSKYKGVCQYKGSKKWVATIYDSKNKKNIYLGSFDDEDEAALSYNKAVKEMFGDGAFINKIGFDNSSKAVDQVKHKYKQNRRPKGKTGFRGVTKSGDKYRGRIFTDNKTVWLGAHDTPEQAAKEYDKRSYELFGDKAILNFPREVERS